MPVTAVTRKAGYKRGSFYLHIKKKDLSLEIMRKYGRAIKYDFSIEIPAIKNSTGDGAEHFEKEDMPSPEELMREREELLKEKEELVREREELTRDRDMWRDRFLDSNDKYMKLLESRENNQQ